MKILFKTIRYKNLLSTGNVFTEIVLNKSPTTLVTGENGNGKCVRGSTKINVKFKNEEVEILFLEFLNKS